MSDNNKDYNPSEIWLTVAETAQLLNINTRTVQTNCKKNLYNTQMVNGKKRKKYKIQLSSLPSTEHVNSLRQIPV